ncbi:MAG: tetratricopeptide repeat protein, partial [Acidobacteria bacterium]|nr:tetratricopeptide repeat protein [Acidobacteriota bacterium]
ADGSLSLAAGAYGTLEALCFAFGESAAASRLIVTCRYFKKETLPPNRFHVEGLAAMPAADVKKKTRKLLADMPAHKRNHARESKAVEVADGNPRLLEWLFDLMRQNHIVDEDFLAALGGVETRFRESLLARTLLGAIAVAERKAVARLCIFELPVPQPVVDALVDGAGISNAVALGLVEGTMLDEAPHFRVSGVLHPLLQDALEEAEWQVARRQAARKLHEVWWKVPGKARASHVFEIVRVGALAGDEQIGVEFAGDSASRLINRSRYFEALALCQIAMSRFPGDYRLLGTVAHAEKTLGATDSARSHYESALAACPATDLEERSSIVHNLAGLEEQQGNVTRALELWRESLDVKERIGDEQGKAATLHQMAAVIARQGHVARALELWQQSLDLWERIGDVHGKASTLHNMAGVIAQHGDVARALELWQQSLDLRERTGDALGKAATLHQMAGVIARQGHVARALELWQESLDLIERIGDVQGKAATLHNMAGAIAQQDMARALELWQQSLDLKERIGNVQGKAATLAQMAWAAHQAGDSARRDQLNIEAARALGSVRAYLDLVTVLGNLGATAQHGRERYAAQAAWIVLRVQAPIDASVETLASLFHQVPNGAPLEPLLAAAAVQLAATRGQDHPKRSEFQDQALELLVIAAGNAGVPADGGPSWYTSNRLDDPNHVIPTLSTHLEALIGDGWIFDRTPLLH